jgi:hypothetical protein
VKAAGASNLIPTTRKDTAMKKRLSDTKLGTLLLAVEEFDVEVDNDGQLVIYTGIYADKLHQDDQAVLDA